MLAFSEEVADLDERSVQFAGIGHQRVTGIVLDHTRTGMGRE